MSNNLACRHTLFMADRKKYPVLIYASARVTFVAS